VVHQTSARAVQRLNVLLLFVLGRNELHVWLHQGGANGLCIVAVILLMLKKRFDVLRCDDFDRVARGLELALSPECACTGLNPNPAGRHSRHVSDANRRF
jgi:hypothetical protein